MRNKSQAYFYPCYNQIVSKISPLLCPISLPNRVATSGSRESSQEEIKGRQNKPNVRTIPALTTVPLTDHKDSTDHDQEDFDYRHVIGKLLYLEKLTRPVISCAVHQCARHCANPKIQHTAAVKWIGRYLLGTKDKGLIMRL